MTFLARRLAAALLAAPLASMTTMLPATAQPAATPFASAATYADLADLADSAALVVEARIRKIARVDEQRARAVKPGQGRFYVVAETRALLTGTSPIGQSFAYLVDVPVDAKGRPAMRKKDLVILFARPVAARPGELQLVARGAQLPWDAATAARVRAILTARLAPDAPARITGVREVIHVAGTLAGEGETQIFLNTADSSAASVTVRRQPGRAPEWGVSFSELVAEVGRPPARETLEWYRLACFLPSAPPPGTNMSEGIEARRIADADYRLVMAALGPCPRAL